MRRLVPSTLCLILLAVLLLPVASLGAPRREASPPVDSEQYRDTSAAPQSPQGAYQIGNFRRYKFARSQPACDGVGSLADYYDRLSCGFVIFDISPADAGKTINVTFSGPDGVPFHSDVAVDRSDLGQPGSYDFSVVPAADWPAGRIGVLVEMAGSDTGSARTFFYHNYLDTTVETDQLRYKPGEPLAVSGLTRKRVTVAANNDSFTSVPADVEVALLDSESTLVMTRTTTAASGGDYNVSFDTSGLPDGIYYLRASSRYNDSTTGAWAGEGRTVLTVDGSASRPQFKASFTSSSGTVRAGDTYLYILSYSNPTTGTLSGARIQATLPDYSYYQAPGTVPSPSAISGQTLSWDLPDLAPDAEGRIILAARAASQAEERTIVWRSLNLQASFSYDGGTPISSRSHGPKVVPRGQIGDTTRFGDRPFPTILVEYADIKHEVSHTGSYFDQMINSDIPGVQSLFNRYQEMSFGQLFPNGAMPSLGKATVPYSATPDYNFKWSRLEPSGFCSGTTTAGESGNPGDPNGPPLGATDRIVNEWYQLPGTQGYYGSDSSGNNYAGALSGQPALVNVDDGCGPTGKLAYDSATLADPDVDYNDFDTDRDGWVDFFEVVYTGQPQNVIGRSGANNVWPHSSSLEYFYNDGEGYVSNDRLRSLTGEELFWTDASHSETTVEETSFPAYVRVGPYNVNAEFSEETTFSHEYGHSLGLPDNYSLGSRDTMNDWDMMASGDGHMSMWDKQELGWLIPAPIADAAILNVSGMRELKHDTQRIEWVDHEGLPYTLSGPDTHNAEAYKVALPSRELFDPALIPSGSYLYYSGAGNDFGYPGHVLDIAFDAQMTSAYTDVILQFSSWFEIEKDFDYGYVMVSTDDGESFQSLPSQAGTTTDTNPNGSNHGNGITCRSGQQSSSYCTTGLGTSPEPQFITDTFDLSTYAGQDFILRFAYSTDAGLAMRGWLIDDLRVLGDGSTIYFDDAEQQPGDGRYVFNGWTRTNGTADAEHAYWIGLRDRSGFDALAEFAPGVTIEYADESHGYGNVGVDNPPALTVLDSQPTPGSNTPNLGDAAFTAAVGDNLFTDCNDPSLAPGARHIDNYTDPNGSDPEERWVFGLRELVMTVSRAGGDPYTADVSFDRDAPCDTELAVSKSGPESIRAGDALTYTISVEKLGPIGDITGVVLTDTLDANLSFVAASDGGVLEGDTVRWDLGTFSGETSQSVTLTVRVKETVSRGTIIENTAMVDAESHPLRRSNLLQTRVRLPHPRWMPFMTN